MVMLRLGDCLMRFVLILLILLIDFNPLLSAPRKYSNLERIAVLTIKNQALLDDQSILYLTKQLRTAINLIVSPSYLLMTQENIDLLVSSEEELRACLESECEITIGQKLQAHYVISAEIFKISASKIPFKLSISLFETKKGYLLSSVSDQAESIDILEPKIKTLAQVLFTQSKLTGLNLKFESKKVEHSKTTKETVVVHDTSINRVSEAVPVKTKVIPAKKPLFEKAQIDWVLIKGGKFEMGHTDYEFSRPVKEVEIKDFWISKTEVTVAQFQKCIDAGVCSLPIDYQTNPKCHWKHPDQLMYPINCIFWDQARKFAQWISADLATEAQWEYAARSEGQELLYPWGDDEASCEWTVMNEKGNVGCGTAGALAVCHREKGNTMQGLCDMSGNVWEFVLDEYQSNYRLLSSHAKAYCSDEDCLFNAKYRVMRGGGFRTIESSYLGNFDRMKVSRDTRDENIGFRVVKE